MEPPPLCSGIGLPQWRQRQGQGTNKRPPVQFIVVVPVLFGLAVGGFLFISIPFTEKFSSTIEKVQKQIKNRGTTCECQPNLLNNNFQGDLLNRQDLVRMAQDAKERVMEKIREDYGNYTEPIFVGPGKSFSPMSQQSEDQLKRKLMIKVLEMQVNVQREKDHERTTCNCGDANTSTSAPGRRPYYAKYVWATGGHSSAAGHGNLYNESYTAHLTRDASIVFDAIGIEFEGRNYAMGNTQSGSEVSMCWQQIFGTDVDFIAWDFALTDLRYHERLFHFGYRAALSPGRPSLLAVRIGYGSHQGWQNVLQLMDQIGMSVFVGTVESYELRRAGVPNSEGLTRAELEVLPYYLRNLVCGEQFEHGDPFCWEAKYTKGACAARPYQTAWHPGFKSHAMDGHALGLFLVDSLINALIDLSQNEIADPLVLLDILRKQDQSTQEKLLIAELPVPFSAIYLPLDNAPLDPSLDLEVFWRGPSLCRTARLPAQSRFLGYTTNTTKIGSIAVQGFEEYESAIPMNNSISADAAKDGFMVLTYYHRDFARAPCDVILTPDYKDFFLAHYNNSRVKLSFPNKMESLAYGYSPSKYKGLLVIIFSQCEYNQCVQGDLRPDDFVARKFVMTVNGEEVTALTSAGFDAFILKGNGGFYWQAQPKDGTFVVTFQVLVEGGFVRLSSIILF